MKNNENAHNYLVQWGLWHRQQDDLNLGYPKMTSFRKLMGATLEWDYDVKDVPVYLTITDDAALVMDKIITSMDLDLRTVLYLFYIKQMKVGEIEKAMGIKKNNGSQLLKTAITTFRHLDGFQRSAA